MLEYKTSDPERFHQLMRAVDAYFHSMKFKNINFEKMLGDIIETGLCNDSTDMYLRVYVTDQSLTFTFDLTKPMHTMQTLYGMIKESVTKINDILRTADLLSVAKVELIPAVGQYSIVLNMNVKAKDLKEKISRDAEYRFIVSKGQRESGSNPTDASLDVRSI